MVLDIKAIESAVSSGLPARARWLLGGTTLDFNFAGGCRALDQLPDDISPSGDHGLPSLLIFGEQNFADGGGARPLLCVRMRDGWVCGFDPDDEESDFLLNSSLDRFIATFRLLNEYLANGEPLPPDCASRIKAIDPEAYSNSDWRALAEQLGGTEPGTRIGVR